MTNAEIIWKYFENKKFNKYAIAGIMGNMKAESNLQPNNLQNTYERSLGMNDEEYTKAVDNGSYINFINDAAGYGLVQFTYSGYKKELYEYCKKQNKSIADITCQLDCLYSQISKSGVATKLNTCTTIRQASDIFLLQYERPKDQSESVQITRAKYAQEYYNQFAKTGREGGSGMKYSDNNKPMVCMMTNATCYKGTRKMQVKGILWHSTGANNPWLKRYVQPDDNATDKDKMLEILGKNPYRNDWNHSSVEAGLNAWIGKLANGTVTTVQVMPWAYRPWGCGGGSKGSCNDGWIQFEICEDSLTDRNYFEAAYKEACELTAYLCKMYGLNPKGNTNLNGVTVPVILCHADSYKLGLGSNHGDIYNWFNRYNKTMDNVRNDVASLINGSGSISIDPGTPTPTQTTVPDGMLGVGSQGAEVKKLQQNLLKLGYKLPKWGDDGDFGEETLAAVLKFQEDNKLEVDGIVGPATQAMIKKLLKAGTTTPTDPTPPVQPVTPTYSGITLGSSSKDERGQYVGGQAGDQTGKEVYTLGWYNQNWTVVLRPNSAELAEKIAQACEAGCANSNIGYDQGQRNTIYTEAKKVGLDLSKITTPCECDCSSFVSTCCICAGLPESIFFAGGNMRVTWNLRAAAQATGQFTILTDSKYLTSGNELMRGDLLVNESQHAVIVLQGGKKREITQPIVTPTQPTNTPYIVRVIVNKLNVRQQPTTNSPITTMVYKGDAYTIVEEKGGWGKLKSGAGWIYLEYTQKV